MRRPVAEPRRPHQPEPPRARVAMLAAVALALASCHDPAPPPRWQQGGAPLVLTQARWHIDGDTIELTGSGQVLYDGDVVFVVDRVGRVVNEDHEPVALLMPDGTIAGTDDRHLGRIGLRNGAPPGSETAWFSIDPSGAVTFYDNDGERYDSGRWTGCEGPGARACTLVTHMAFIRASQRRRRSGLGIGYGVWMWR